MNPTICAASVESVLAFVASREQGATCREVAAAVFGEGGTRTTARSYAGQILNVLAALGHVRAEKDADNVLVYHREHWWPTTVESIAITPRFLWLMIHIIEYGIKHGTLGNPATHALLEHLKRERERLDVPARGKVGT